MNLSRVVALAGLWCAAVPAPLLAQRPAMKLDQANTATWQNAWTNLLNDVRQSFTPALSKLVAVKVGLVVAWLTQLASHCNCVEIGAGCRR